MKRIRIHAGLLLIGLGVVYMIGASPWLPGWLWALVGSGLYYALVLLAEVDEARGYGAFFLGWGLGALASDLTGLQSLKLVGAGTGLVLWGWLERASLASWLGAALLGAGVLVFVWESSLGAWAALALLALGLYLAVRRPPEEGTQRRVPTGNDEVFGELARWRSREAQKRGCSNVEVLSDGELACLANLPSPAALQEVAACLGGDEERARVLYELLKDLRARAS